MNIKRCLTTRFRDTLMKKIPAKFLHFLSTKINIWCAQCLMKLTHNWVKWEWRNLKFENAHVVQVFILARDLAFIFFPSRPCRCAWYHNSRSRHEPRTSPSIFRRSDHEGTVYDVHNANSFQVWWKELCTGWRCELKQSFGPFIYWLLSIKTYKQTFLRKSSIQPTLL